MRNGECTVRLVVGISAMSLPIKDELMAWDTSEELGEVNYSCEDDNAACDV